MEKLTITRLFVKDLFLQELEDSIAYRPVSDYNAEIPRGRWDKQEAYQHKIIDNLDLPDCDTWETWRDTTRCAIDAAITQDLEHFTEDFLKKYSNDDNTRHDTRPLLHEAIQDIYIELHAISSGIFRKMRNYHHEQVIADLDTQGIINYFTPNDKTEGNFKKNLWEYELYTKKEIEDIILQKKEKEEKSFSFEIFFDER